MKLSTKQTGTSHNITQYQFICREKANTIHHAIVELFTQWIPKFGMEADIVKDDEVKDIHMKDKDLCITIGGDSTYL